MFRQKVKISSLFTDELFTAKVSLDMKLKTYINIGFHYHSDPHDNVYGSVGPVLGRL